MPDIDAAGRWGQAFQAPEFPDIGVKDLPADQGSKAAPVGPEADIIKIAINLSAPLKMKKYQRLGIYPHLAVHP